MKLFFLGTGSFFSFDNYHTNILLEDDDKKALLIDCGTDISRSLYDANKDMTNIESVYISHMHGDHVGGLEYMGYMSYFNPDYKEKPKIIAHQDVMRDIWQILEPSMGVLYNARGYMHTYFDIENIIDDVSKFQWHGILFNLIEFNHIVNYGGSSKFSYGLDFTINNKKVLITTDCCYANPSNIYWEEAINGHNHILGSYDYVFNDCETLKYLGSPDSQVHCLYDELKRIDKDVKKNMWLVHYQGSEDKLPDAKADGFAGFVKKGQEFEF